ncbi:MAG TPA: efflux RND transporter permease subunit [Thermoanaerobaculia bacterium]|jgi:HAE1 family hydrophobic/amphiphilic exporter-1|nr:efflux RND transporter permease subunit [Thermoanaerobaculia bacterium]
MQKLAELCVRRPVFATVLILALVVVGIFAYFQLGVDRFPNVEFPFVVITTVLPGAAPEEMETEVTDKIEEAVNTINGIDQLISTSSENVSLVQIQFTLEKNPDVAAQEVRDKVNAILANLPKDADPPIIQKINADADPVISIALSGPASQREISEYADRVLRRRLETVFGVGQVKLVGQRLRQINVITDTAKLDSLGLTAADVVNALGSQNVQIPGGKVAQSRRDLTLRTYGRVGTPADFARLPITRRNGYPVRVGDVARIEDGVEEAQSVATVAGKPAVVLQVIKQSGTNTIAVVDAIKERFADLKGQIPAGWHAEIVRDQSKFIVAAVDAVKEHLMVGSLFAAGIVWLFLRRFRPTLISAVAIPSSLIATFAAMKYMGFTLNVLTLLALTLAVGIVIDDAVVVLENIFRFMEEKKMTPRQAAVEGTKEVGLAVLATSLSLIAVFLPVAFMGGIVGRFMYSFGITMAFAIAVSLVVAFTLTPMLASRWLKPTDAGEGGHGSRQKGFYSFVERIYMRLLDWSMAHRWVIVVVMILVFFSTVPLFMAVNKNFLPNDDESQFQVVVRVPEGANLATTQTILESVASQVRKLPGVVTTVNTIGNDPQQTPNLGLVYVQLSDPKTRTEDQFHLMQRVRAEILPQYQALKVRAQVAQVSAFGNGVDNEIQFWIGGPDLDKLNAYAQTLKTALAKVPGTTDVDTNFIVGKPELGVRIDRDKTADLGVRVQDIASSLNVLVGGQKATSYFEGGEEYEVHVRAGEADRNNAQAIAAMEVPSLSRGTVPLRDLVTLNEGTGPSLINRLNRRRQVMVTANMRPGFSSQTAIDALNRTAAELKMPAGFSFGLTGRSREQGKAANAFLLAFALSIIFMYLILAAQFESWVHPFTILLSLPMTVPFALLSILMLNQSVNIFSMLGILVLFGIVKKNSILQIDHTNGLRAQGMPRAEAIREANRDRLRPILMTTLAFVAGMIPLVASSGTGAGTNRAIASVILGGQLLSLLLTLIGTPVTYSIFDDWANSKVFSRLGERLARRRPKESVIGQPSPVTE